MGAGKRRKTNFYRSAELAVSLVELSVSVSADMFVGALCGSVLRTSLTERPFGMSFHSSRERLPHWAQDCMPCEPHRAGTAR